MIEVLQIQILAPPSGEVASLVPSRKALPTEVARALSGAPAKLPLHSGHSRSGTGTGAADTWE